VVESEIAYGNVIDLERARECVLESINDAGTEQAGIINAFGRTLAEYITAELNLSMCDIALIDGYALDSSDTKGATDREPRSLGILAEFMSPGKELKPGTAIIVHAGDPIPSGADTVVPFDQAFRPNYGPEVLIQNEVRQTSNIQPAGTLSCENGNMLIPSGTVIGPREMSLLAHLGRPGVCVRRRPRVAIITTGADIVEIVEEIEPGLARNRSRYEIVGMVMEAGCELGRLVHVRNGRTGIEKAVLDSLDSEVIIVSLGPRDKHESAVTAITNLGDVRFTGIHLKPGLATAFGMVEGRPVFVIASVFALESFEALIRPALLKALARIKTDRKTVSAVLNKPLGLNPGYTHYIRSSTAYQNERYETYPSSSSKTRTDICADSIIIIPPQTNSLKRGDMVEVMML
jgi:molybdopterin molybdotransferase